jgi:CubicO group peptidase (beta-lactamase class C family)
MRTFRLLTMTAALGVLSAVAQSNVKRLDGSQITPVEIDAGVTRLMRAAEVTGVGLAIFNDGKVAYLKAYGVRDKEKNLLLKPWPGLRDGAAPAAEIFRSSGKSKIM